MSSAPRPRLLLLGERGQVGWELARTLAPLGDVHALDRAALDLADADRTRATIRTLAPDVIVNAAAYTQVDRAESEVALAHRINGDAPGVIAEEALRVEGGPLLVHYSTDYVFDGAGTRPYTEDDATSPRSAYGASKLAGDLAVLKTGVATYIFRVGWVYGRRGGNFLRTIERLAREKPELRVVADQHGAPTWSRAIAETTALAVGQWLMARRTGGQPPASGVYHMASPDHTTWHEFASAIVAAMPAAHGWTRPSVQPITSAEYPTPTPRPRWSVLDSTRLRDTFGLALPSWRNQLARCVDSAP